MRQRDQASRQTGHHARDNKRRPQTQSPGDPLTEQGAEDPADASQRDGNAERRGGYVQRLDRIQDI